MERYILAELWICILCLMTDGAVRGRARKHLAHGGERNLPSKGFIRASLAMVAQAPLVAAARGWCTPARLPPMRCLTASYVAKYTAWAGPKGRQCQRGGTQRHAGHRKE